MAAMKATLAKDHGPEIGERGRLPNGSGFFVPWS
jgi:hypothetical protein